MPALTVNTAAAPARTQSRDDFNANVAAHTTWLYDSLIPEFNIAVDLINTKAADVAAAVATVAIWVSGAAYTSGNVRYSPANWQNYRRKTTSSAGVTDPSDDTTNWAPIVSLASLTLTGTTTLDLLVGTSVTDSSSSTTGGAKFAGGVGIAKALYVGGVANVLSGIVILGGTSASDMWAGAVNGLQLKGKTGSTYDLTLMGTGVQVLMGNPTGTSNMYFAGDIIAGAAIRHKSYTVATRPAHSDGNIIYVSDGAGGANFQGSKSGTWVNLG